MEWIREIIKKSMDEDWCPMDGVCERTDDHCWECFTDVILQAFNAHVDEVVVENPHKHQMSNYLTSCFNKAIQATKEAIKEG